MVQADLHLHSSASDGLFPPREVMRRAHGVGLAAAGLTDHDTVSGLAEGQREARQLGVDFIPGCEISIDCCGVDVHLLAYFIDPEHPRLTALLETIHRARQERLREMVGRLNALGVPLRVADVAHEAQRSSSVGRLHVARALVRCGAVGSIEEAFRRWIGPGSEAYLPKRTPAPQTAIAALRAAGGVLVLGHPALYGLAALEETFADWQLDGVEVYHPAHTPKEIARLLAWARARQLAVTGGSDWHGDERPEAYIGCVGVDRESVAELRRRRSVSG